MIALRLRRFGSLRNEQAEIYRVATSTGPRTLTSMCFPWDNVRLVTVVNNDVSG